MIAIILDRPSRFDTEDKLIQGYAGQWFWKNIFPNVSSNSQVTTLDKFQDFKPEVKVAFLLGEETLQFFKPEAQLNSWRGCPFTIKTKLGQEIICVASYTPQDAFDRKNYGKPTNETKEDKGTEKDHQKTNRKNRRFWLYHDTKKVLRYHSFGIKKYSSFDTKLYPSADFICATFDSFINKELSFDIETDPRRNITCFSVAWESSDQTISSVTIPVKTYKEELAYEAQDMLRIFRSLGVLFTRNTIIGHNLMFDLLICLYKYKIPVPPKLYDTMLAHHRCYPEVEKSLAHCISLYLDLPYHKDEAIFEPKNFEQEQQLWKYNAKDVYTTLLIYKAIKRRAEMQVATSSVDQACRSVRPYLFASVLGARVNTEARSLLYNKQLKRYEQYCRILKILCGFSFNPRSPQQVSKYYYDYLGHEKPAKDPTHELNLLKLYAKTGIPSLRVVLAAREAGKSASGLKFALWKGSRMTCAWIIAGPNTFRLGSRALLANRGLGLPAHLKKGWGTNFQNWNKKQRYLIEADEGKSLIQVDQAGAEAKIVAYLADPGQYLQLFLNNIKPHVFVALHLVPNYWSQLLSMDIAPFIASPISKLKSLPGWKELEKAIKLSDESTDPQKRYYYIAKTVCHESNYDASAQMIQLTTLLKSDGSLRLSLDLCKQFRNLYLQKLFPEIQRYHFMIQHKLSKNRRLTNLFGFPREFNDFWGPDLFKQAYAFIPQSTVGSISNIALTEIQERIDSNDKLFQGVDVLQNGHDSGLFQAPDENANQSAIEIKKHFERELLAPSGIKFRMGAEVQIGKNWGSASDDNPNGMKEVKL